MLQEQGRVLEDLEGPVETALAPSITMLILFAQ